MELLVVIVLIAIIGGLVAPSLSGTLPSLRVRKAGDELMAATRKAHHDAAVTGRRFRLMMVAQEDELGGPRWYLASEPWPLERPGLFKPLAGPWGKAVELPDYVTFSTIEGAGTDDATSERYIEFRTDGTATEATVTIASQKGDTVTFKVDPASGRASFAEAEVLP